MIRSILSLVVSALCLPFLIAKDTDPDPKSLAISNEQNARAKVFILGLANSSFAERESATSGLKTLGRLALPALRDAIANNPNPEVQLRCDSLLAVAVGDDIDARIDCFLADTKCAFEHDLPVIKQYVTTAGRSEESRSLFRDMMESPNRPLLLAVGGPPEYLGKLIGARCSLLRPGRASTADIASIMFAESTIPERLSPRTPHQAHDFVGRQSAFGESTECGPNKAVHLSIQTTWLGTRDDPSILYSVMQSPSGTESRSPTGMLCARKLLRSTAAPGHMRLVAMAFIANNGNAEDMSLVEGLLKDKSVIYKGIIRYNRGEDPNPGQITFFDIQARDAALQACIYKQKKNPADFGIAVRGLLTKVPLFIAYFNGPDADADRDAAVEKYEEWKGSDKDKRNGKR